jgi:hypothetical protein
LEGFFTMTDTDTALPAVRKVGRPFTSENNPGRPRGSKNRKTLMAEKLLSKDVKAITEVVSAAAKAGDITAAKLVLERLLPPPKSRSTLIKFPMPQIRTHDDAVAALGAVVEAVAQGLLTIDEGNHMGALTARLDNMIETSELAVTVATLKNVTPGALP